jgi:predicted nucleotidyltransferase
MIKEIQSILSRVPELKGVYGFGSYFRSQSFRDCDVLLVIADASPNPGRLHSELSSSFTKLGTKLGITFDVTILTETEHSRAPLREHPALVTLGLKSETKGPNQAVQATALRAVPDL